MTTEDYIFSAVFILLILRQVRGRALTTRSLLLPVAIVTFAAFRYLHGFPTGGNNLTLVLICGAIGLTLGLLSAMATTVRLGPEGNPTAKVGAVAILLWLMGTGSRLAFAEYATHGGGPTIAQFTRAHDITSRAAITTALIVMALTEVIARYGLLGLRGLAIHPNGERVLRRRPQPCDGNGNRPTRTRTGEAHAYSDGTSRPPPPPPRHLFRSR